MNGPWTWVTEEGLTGLGRGRQRGKFLDNCNRINKNNNRKIQGEKAVRLIDCKKFNEKIK